MKIILHSLCAGPDGVHQPGARDVPDELAQRLIDAGHAVPDDGKPGRESTVLVPAHETNTLGAARPRGKPRGN